MKGRAERGVRDSEVMVIGRAKRVEFEVKVLKAVWRSLFAVIPDCILVVVGVVLKDRKCGEVSSSL